MEYFIIIDGVQSGPMSKDQLMSSGVRPDSYVWRQGLPDWVKAETLPELADAFMADSAFGGYARPEEPLNPYAGQQPYGNNAFQTETPYGQHPDPYSVYGREPAPVPHTNWLPWAIVGTVFGALFSCIGMIFGIIAVSRAQKANRYYEEGFRMNGDLNNASARTMTIIALVLGGVGFILTVTGVAQNLLYLLMEIAD